MANRGVAGDLSKAKELRGLAKSIVDREAKERILDASARLEKQAAKKASRIGRKLKMRKGSGNARLVK